MANWARMIDSAQRRFSLTDVVCPNWQTIPRLEFEIQGLVVHSDSDPARLYPFAAMAESGVVSRGAKPLSIWDRIKRRPAPIGELKDLEGARFQLCYWTDPELCIEFDLENEADACMWRECEIMALNGGFHFQVPPRLRAIVQSR